VKTRSQIALFISPLLGCALGYGVAQAANAGWLSNDWEPLGHPPQSAVRVLSVSDGEAWVSSITESIFHWPSSPECRYDCWQEVAAVGPTATPAPWILSLRGEECAPPRPLPGKVSQASQCSQEHWLQRTTTIAIIRDGSALRWRADVNIEGAGFAILALPFGGALVVFLLTLASVLFLQLLEWLGKRAEARPPLDSPPSS
jgi:hypothetical protein